MIQFTEYEIQEMAKSPEVLRALADFWDCMGTMHCAYADIFNGELTFEAKRKAELLHAADLIEASY